jgi:hypothetical protein
MPGERFSGLYLQPGDPTQDSGRARHRVGALFRETVFNNHTGPLAVFVGRELGVAVTGDGRYHPTGISSFASAVVAFFSTPSPWSIAISSGMSVTEPRTGGAMPCGKSLPRNA